MNIFNGGDFTILQPHVMVDHDGEQISFGWDIECENAQEAPDLAHGRLYVFASFVRREGNAAARQASKDYLRGVLTSPKYAPLTAQMISKNMVELIDNIDFEEMVGPYPMQTKWAN